MLKICKDGRIWGQNNELSSTHLGISVRKRIVGKGFNPNSKGRPFKKGIPSWNAGTAICVEYNQTFNSEFKDLIRKRDKFSCQVCGCSQSECIGKLNIHHIDYGKTNDNPLNLVSLCRSCHTRTNAKREHWEQYFKNHFVNMLGYAEDDTERE